MDSPFPTMPRDDAQQPILLWLLLLVTGTCLYRIAFVWAHDYSLFMDEAQYWLWAQTPDWGYYSKPPLVAWLIRGTTALLGNSELAVKLPALLAYPLASVGLFLTGRAMADARTGLVAAAVFLTMPGQAIAGWVMSPDSVLLLAWAFALVLAWHAMRAPERLRTWVLLGLVIGLGALAKYTMLVFVPMAAWAFARTAAPGWWRRPGPWTAVALALLVLAPNIAWNAAHHFETVTHTANLSHKSAPGIHLNHFGEFLGAQWGIFGLLAFPLLAMRAWSDRSEAARFLRPFTVPYLLVMLALSLVTSANANWAVTAYAAGSVLLALWLAVPQRRRWLWAVLATNALLMLALLHYRDIGPRLGIKPSRSGNDLYARVLGWRELGQTLQPVIDANGGLPVLAADRVLLSELTYYLQPRPYAVAALDTDGVIDNQYELTTQQHGLPREALWIEFPKGMDVDNDYDPDDAPDPALLTHLYDTVEDLGLVRVTRMDAPTREVHIVRVRMKPGASLP